MIGETAAAEPTRGRRQRELATPRQQLVEAIALKVLHGWLQNRHQTLVPLAANLRSLSAEERSHVLNFAALTSSAGDNPDETADSMAAWLRSVGCDESGMRRFEEARAFPSRLGETLSAVRTPDLSALAFIVALVAARTSGPSGRAFADYVAARMELPATAVRSARRRYGG